MKKATAILTADLHLRETAPIARTDNFVTAQISKLKFIKELAEKHECPTFIAGDIFDKAKSSPFVEAMALSHFPKETFVIPGNHCLPSHNLNNFDKSSLRVLEAAKTITALTNTDTFDFLTFTVTGFPFGTTFTPKYVGTSFNEKVPHIALLHLMIHKDKPIHESIESTKALSLLKNSSYDLIVVGDNHTPFTVEHEGRLLVNCGALTRITAGQIDYKPAVWLWYADTNTVEKVYLPIEKGVISREHIEKKDKKDKRMEAFIERVDTSYELGIDFPMNVESYFRKNVTRKGIKEIIRKSMEEDA